MNKRQNTQYSIIGTETSGKILSLYYCYLMNKRQNSMFNDDIDTDKNNSQQY